MDCIVPGLVATSCFTFLDRDIHTHFLRMAMVIIATIDVVVSWSESHTLGDKSDEAEDIDSQES